ncbi:MAG: alpha/beta fold hydrolase [Chloroflexi bacterium]|nr:alpha/beta fold hydrolase [Chloroflexota bacterium]
MSIAMLIAVPASAQEGAPPEPTRVELTAEDGLVLIGDFYTSASNQPQPALLLMHMYNGKRQDWQEWIAPLTAAGYNVLTVDLRGFGESGQRTNWELAQTDTQDWLDWLAEQTAVQEDRIGIIGASIGANLALVGCANNEACRTAVALSPGENYYDVEPMASIEAMGRRSILLVAAQLDRESATAVRAFDDGASSRTSVGLVLFSGTGHGTDLIRTKTILTPFVIDWLAQVLAVRS